MTTRSDGAFRTLTWEEKAPEDQEQKAVRVSHAHTTSSYKGVIAGTSVSEYVMYYSGAGEGWGAGSYRGYERVDGTVGGRSGSFILEHRGDSSGTTVSATWTVVEGSGTADLATLSGRGGFTSEHGDEATTYTFEHTFEGRA
jgi:Protein of unknown function (DUF3224)